MKPELKKAYEEGYETGLHWNESWLPGGLWVPMTSIERYAKMKQEMQEIHDDWHKGFQDGRKATITPILKAEETY